MAVFQNMSRPIYFIYGKYIMMMFYARQIDNKEIYLNISPNMVTDLLHKGPWNGLHSSSTRRQRTSRVHPTD